MNKANQNNKLLKKLYKKKAQQNQVLVIKATNKIRYQQLKPIPQQMTQMHNQLR